jgi:peptide/nickel transport system substrate-binding protein
MTRARAIAARVIAALICGCAAPPPDRPGVLNVSVEQASAWVRNFNPLLVGTARWPTRGGIYEPLAIWNAVAGKWVPWLATSQRWSADHLRLTFTLRDGVSWSDGTPFTATDVAFTFNLLKQKRALDASGVWDFLAAVRAVDARTVVMSLARPYVPGLVELAQQPIVPAHIWQNVADPLAFANPDPVGTGPFTEVRVFRNQVWELGKNRRYWQAGVPRIEALRMVAYPSNDQANLALVEGEVDWAGNFVPDIERTFIARDRQTRGYWYPAVGSMVFLYPNTERPPLDDVRVRKALSLAIDRERVVAIGMYGYTHPADGTGLSELYASWRDGAVASDGWVQHDPRRAARLLDGAGWMLGRDGVRHKAGQRLAFALDVVSGWSDWVRAAEVIARDLSAVGVAVELRAYEWGAWFQRLQSGAYELSLACPGLGFSFDAPTPYYAYRWILDGRAARANGELLPTNWNRYGDARADAILAELETSDEPTHQHALMSELEQRFAATAPALPMFANPLWGAFNTRRFVGFPTAQDPYAKLSPHSEPENLIVLTQLAPRQR